MKPLLAIGIVVAVALVLMHASWALFGQGRFLAGNPAAGKILHPINITATGGTISDSAPLGTQIFTLAITMSDGSPFSGTLTAQDGTGIVCSVSPCTVGTTIVAARNVTATDDGQHTVAITANSGTQPFTKAFTLVVQPTVIGAACDVGPNYIGTIPDPATKAGYTHCLINLDFTTSTFTNINTWLDCFMTSGAPLMYYSNNNVPPCNAAHFQIVTDGGVQVFKETLTVADVNSSGYRQTQITSSSYQGSRVVKGTTLPLGNYVEWVSRVGALATSNATNQLLWAPYSYNPETGDNDTFLEEDWGELRDTNVATNPSNLNTAGGWWNCGGNIGVCYGVGGTSPAISENPLVYNTHGMLITGDGSTATAFCGYTATGAVSGLQHSNFVGCIGGNWNNPGQGGVFVRNQILLALGPEPFQSGSPTLQADETAFIQRVTVWVCPGGGQPAGGSTVGNQCNVSPVLQASPPL
jgi:hypothetical protein